MQVNANKQHSEQVDCTSPGVLCFTGTHKQTKHLRCQPGCLPCQPVQSVGSISSLCWLHFFLHCRALRHSAHSLLSAQPPQHSASQHTASYMSAHSLSAQPFRIWHTASACFSHTDTSHTDLPLPHRLQADRSFIAISCLHWT